MTTIEKNNKKRTILLSVGLHLVIFTLLFMHLPHTSRPSKDNVNIVHAVAINQPVSSSQPAQPMKSLPKTSIRQIQQIALKETLETVPIKSPPPPKTPEKSVQHEEMSLPVTEDIEKKQEAQEKQKLIAEKKAKEAKERKAKLEREEQRLAKQQQEMEAKDIQQALAKVSKVKQPAPATQEEASEDEEDNTLDEQINAEKNALTSAKASSQQSGEADKYKQMIVQSISRKWLIPDTVDKDLTCQLLVHVGPGGVVVSIDLLKESGDPTLDRAARNAVMKAAPLPVPENAELFDNFRTLRLTFRPQGVVSG